MTLKLLSNKIVRFFLSRNVAIILLILMTVLLVLSTQLPDLNSMNEDTLRLFRLEYPIASSLSAYFGGGGIISKPWFYILPAFIFLSTLFCTIERFIKQKKKDIGFWGSMIFHAGLLTIIVAGVVTALTLFEAEVLLTEGYPVSLGKEGYLKISRQPSGGIDLPQGTINMVRYRNVYEGDFAIDHEATIILERDGRQTRETIKVNQALEIDGLQYALNRYGFAPAFVVKDENGEVLVDAFINLVVIQGKEDSFEIPGKDIRVIVRFHPDFEMTPDGPRSKSRLPNNPVVAVKVQKGARETKFIHIKLGEEKMLKGLTIGFPELKYWAHFLVHRDRGILIFTVGFFLIVGGLSARFLTMKRKGG